MKPEYHQSGRAWVAVVRAYNTCSSVMNKQIEPTGFNLLEHEVLINLLLNPGQSQQQLATRCFSAKSGISGIVNKLEKQGILKRLPDKKDARKKLLFLSDIGTEQATVNFRIQNEIIQTMASVYSAESILELETGMNSMTELLKERYL